MLTIKQLKFVYRTIVITTPNEITLDEHLSTIIKWFAYYIIKNKRKEANEMYERLIKVRTELFNKEIEDIFNKYDTTNTTNDTL